MDQICPNIVFSVQNRTNARYHLIQHNRISQGTKFHLNETILHFWIKFNQKRYFRSKRENLNIIIESIIFELSAKFQHEQTILIFWTKFAQIRSFWSKTKKVNITNIWYTNKNFKTKRRFLFSFYVRLR